MILICDYCGKAFERKTKNPESIIVLDLVLEKRTVRGL